MLNQLVLVGRVLDEPVVKEELENGKQNITFKMAIQRNFKNSDGEYDTDIVNVKVSEGLSLVIGDNLKKNLMVAIKGRLQAWTYELDINRKLDMLEIVAEKMTFLSSN